MKAVRFHEYGDPSVLRYEDVEQPVPGAGQVLIRVAATSFNGVDGNIRAGFMQGPIPVTLPHTPGIDVSGTVAALGEGVEGFAGRRPGRRVPADGGGRRGRGVRRGSGRDPRAGARRASPWPTPRRCRPSGLTAWQALFDHAKLTAGQRVLINGAGGAVGGYAVQLAKNAGAYVIATASPRSSDRVKAAGADEVIDHTTTAVTAATAPVDVVLNLAPIEPAQLAALLDLIQPGGVLVNTTVWMPAPSDEQRGVRGIDLFVRSDAQQLAHLVELVDRGELRIEVAQRVPLAELSALHADAAAGNAAQRQGRRPRARRLTACLDRPSKERPR